VIAKVANSVFENDVAIVDSASAMAKASRELGPREGTGNLRCYVTDASRLEQLAGLFLGETLSSYELVDL
jgi:hypothetical protein